MMDQEIKRGSCNGSFLVLNLGSNTLEVGNSFEHQILSGRFHQTQTATTLKCPDPNETDNGFEIVSSSDEEGSFSTSEASKTRRGSDDEEEEEEDPEWVPEKKARKSGNSTNRASKVKQGTAIRSKSPITSLGGFNGMFSSGSGPPPPHLMRLLALFGWKVVFQPGKGDCNYISPNGIPYFSLPKAFETFLQGTSKYSEKASICTNYLESSSLHDSLVQRTATSSSCLGVRSENASAGIADIRWKRTGRRKRNSNLEKNIKPIEPIEEGFHPKDNPVINNCKTPFRTAETVEGQITDQASSLCKVNEKTKCYAEERGLSNGFKRDHLGNGKFSGLRRSGRMNGKHVTGEMNVISGSCVDGDKAKGKQQNSTPRSESVLLERTEACRIDKALDNDVRNLNCSGVMRSVQKSRRSIGMGRRSVGLRRSGRLSKKNDVINRDLDTEKLVKCSFLAGNKSSARSNARKEEGRPFTREAVLEENTDCSTSDESSHGETKRARESNANDMHGCHDTTGIRRSMRINGKHVPVDNDSDLEIGFEDYLLFSSEFDADLVAKKDKEKPLTSSSEIASAPDDMLKKTNISNPVYHKSRFEKCIASPKDKSLETPVSNQRAQSFGTEGKLTGAGNFNRKKKEKRRGGCGLTIRRMGKDDHQKEILTRAKINLLSWLIDCGTLTEKEKVFYITKNSVGTSPGFVTRNGIWCYCCKETVSLSKFVAHAGGKLEKTWDKIFLLSGKTFLSCLKEAWEKEKIQRKVGFKTVRIGDSDPSDDTCGICADGGHLICCDSCPSTFHQTCLMLKTLPEGSWYCPYCICKICTTITCLLSCKQCGHKYHKECGWGNDTHLMGTFPFSFCGKSCKKVATELSDMLGITNPIEDGYSWTLLKCLDEDAGIISSERLSFIMESNIKLSMALSVFDECFVPLIDRRTGVDMICQAVYNCGSNFNRLNYEGFYTLILEKDEEIVSAASLRLHGTSLAEMPFIGTRPMYRKQGMCRRLLKLVEDMLCLLHVEKLIIPAIPEMMETWMTSFSFMPLEPFVEEEIKNYSLMVFAETTLLQKSMQSTQTFIQEDVVTVGNGASYGNNIQETNGLQRSCHDQINTGMHFGNWKNIQENHELPRSFHARNHRGYGINMHESHDPKRSCTDQINTRSHSVDNFVGSGEIAQDNHQPKRSFSDQMSAISHFESGNNIQRSFSNLINSRNHFGNGINMQRSSIDHDWTIYKRILKGQPCATPKDSSAAPASLANGTFSEATLFQCTFPNNITARVAPTVPSKFSSGSISEASTDAVIDNDPLAAADSQVTGGLQGSDEVKDLLMDAIRSGISFDNLLRGTS